MPQFVGAMRGINPMAGDMTAAFNNFFGTINRSVQQTVNTFGKIEAQRIADENKTLSKLAVFDATKAFNKDPDTALQSMPSSVVIDGSTVDVADRKSYTESFSHALGTLSGQKLLNNFKYELLNQQIQPENYDAFKANFFAQNYSNGTGNAFHDKAMTDAWNANTPSLDFINQQNLAKRAVERKAEVVNKSIYEQAQTPENINHENYLDAVSQVQELDRSLTPGQAASRVVGLYLDAAKGRADTSRRLSNFIHQPFYDEDGNKLPSLYDRFPAQMDKHLNDLMVKNSKYVTQQGSDAIAKAQSQLGQITKWTSTQQGLAAKVRCLPNTH